MQKQIQLRVKGMQRDLSASAFNPEYAYENKNIRIMPTDESTLFSIINERGNKPSSITGIGDNLVGTPIGQSLINNELVVFTAGNKFLNISDISAEGEEISDITGEELTIDLDLDFDDRIYKLWFSGGKLNGKRLFKGQLGFDPHYPIEAISFYENSDIRKVYWTDKLNQPRVINIAAADNVISKWNSDSFDFVRKLKLQEEVTIERNIVTNGTSAPGVIQYAFTYFNKYGQESNIFYTSPLYYVSYNNRGASPEDKVGNSFSIVIDNIDKSFDYVRIYSIYRTSIDAVPTVKRVVDLATPSGATEYSMTTWNKRATADNIEVYNISQGTYIPLSSITPNSTSSSVNSWSLAGSAYRFIRFTDRDYMYINESKTAYIRVTNRGTAIIYYADRTAMTVYLYTKSKVSYTDNGTSGDIIDPTELLYVGGEEVVFGTMAQKDNTLFIGDYTINRSIINKNIREYFKKIDVTLTKISYQYDIETAVESTYYDEDILNRNSSSIKHFKYLETYRLGVQFQHITGKWSEPIFIKDVTINKQPTNYNGGFYFYTPKITIDNKDIIEELFSLGYIGIRPVVVYPEGSDRTCICQGLLCPTVFNYMDRYNNSPFAQASWFYRANPPYDLNYPGLDQTVIQAISTETPRNGGIPEFRHYLPIPHNYSTCAEIQNIRDMETVSSDNIPNRYRYENIIVTDKSQDNINKLLGRWSNLFYIDNSIVTLHSPELEFDDIIQNTDLSNLKLRIIGVVPLTSFYSDIDIQTSTPSLQYKGHSNNAPGFLKFNVSGKEGLGYRIMMNGPLWFDEVYGRITNNNDYLTVGFVVYPFNRNGSLNNQNYADSSGYRSAKLQYKKLSNMRYSAFTNYFDNSSIINLNTVDSKVFNSEEVTYTKVKVDEHLGVNSIWYNGNVDKVLTSTTATVDGSEYSRGNRYYDIISAGYGKLNTGSPLKLWDSTYKSMIEFVNMCEEGAYSKEPDKLISSEPIRMNYRSTPHAVISLGFDNFEKQIVLPTGTQNTFDKWTDLYKQSSMNGVWDNLLPTGTKYFYWDKSDKSDKYKFNGFTQDVIDIYSKTQIDEFKPACLSKSDRLQYNSGWLWLGELYNDNIVNRFGGTSEEALENNTWIPSDKVTLLTNGDSTIKDSIDIYWLEGDTYFQRYDNLKTYAPSLEEQNGISELVSFMCETRINLAGRYDRNKGNLSLLTSSPSNFNLLNKVYSQNNNFFTTPYLNLERFSLNTFNNSLSWTKTKTAGSLIDAWTNITLASTLDLDGDKGDVRAIRRFNNTLIAFQDRGISQILYNENMQITSTEGVPIEIANSGKVNGKRYLSDKIGCANKWSICETSNGIYFIDDTTKGIFLFNGKLDNLSDRLGFHSWINAKSTGINIWNPVDFNGFVTYYDKVNGDVFFISKDECLAFSEPLGQFTSFYSYEHMPYFTNLEDRGIAFNTDKGGTVYKAWLHNEGEYNMFFNKYCPFYTTVIANPDMAVDKIFNNLEFRADSWNGNTLLNTTFDTLTTWNEYQTGTSTLNNILGRPSELKKKFRIWRANIPRDKSNGRDRMRNPWLYIKLSMEGENTNKTVLHDMIVHYFE